MPRQKKGLTQEERDVFHREGYLVVEDLLPAKELDAVIAEVNQEITSRAQALLTAGKVTGTYEEQGFERQLIALDAEDSTIVPTVSSGTLAGPEIFRMICNPRLLDIAESLCGPEIIASSVYRLRAKMPGDPRGEVPWHQDSGYLDPYCDKNLILTVWVPLVDSNLESGCLFVLPRAHRSEVFRHQRNGAGTYLEIDTADFPRGLKAAAVPVPRGGVLLMTNRTPHASFRNKGSGIRWSMDIRYQSASLPTNAQISRIETEQEHRDRESVPPACYPPSLDFLVRSCERPEDVVVDPEAFSSLRTRHRALYDAGFASSKPTKSRGVNPFSLQRWERD